MLAGCMRSKFCAMCCRTRATHVIILVCVCQAVRIRPMGVGIILKVLGMNDGINCFNPEIRFGNRDNLHQGRIKPTIAVLAGGPEVRSNRIKR